MVRAPAVKLRRWSSYASFTVAIVLLMAKAAAWLATDSLSLLAALVDALVDAAAALVTLVGVHVASQPADAMHRYGHGKVESLAASFQALLLGGASTVLIFDGVHRLISPHVVTRLDVGLAVIGGTTAVTVLLVTFESYVVRRTQSHAIAADRTHHLADVAASLAVLLALALTRLTGWPHFDPLFAIGIALFFGLSAFRMARSAADTLLDHELPDALRRRIEQLVRSHPQVRGIHDLRTRSSGLVQFIEFHLELDGDLSVSASHAIVDTLEASLRGVLPAAEVIVHVEPAGICDARLDARIAPE